MSPDIAGQAGRRHGQAMRFAVFCAAAFLAACATDAPPAATTPVAVATPTATPPRAPPNILNSAGRPDAATMDAVVRNLGAADITRQDGAGTVLTYRLEHCGLLLIFAADARNVMRLSEASAGPRRANEAVPTLDQCVAEARARPRR